MLVDILRIGNFLIPSKCDIEGNMALESSEIREGFIRQRRNLILISILLVFAQFSGGLLLEKLNVFGNTATLTNPIKLETLLWIGFCYLLIRYYQYFHYSGPLGFQDTFFNKRKLFYQKLIIEKSLQYNTWLEEQKKTTSGDDSSVKRITVKSTHSFRQLLWDAGVTVSLHVEYEDNHYSLPQENFIIQASHLIIPNFISLNYVILKTPIVTHYFFPFLIALFPIAIEIFPSAFIS